MLVNSFPTTKLRELNVKSVGISIMAIDPKRERANEPNVPNQVSKCDKSGKI